MDAYMRKRFTEGQIIAILREAEVNGAVILEVCRKHNIIDKRFSLAEQVRRHDGFRCPQVQRAGVGECPVEDRGRTDSGH